MSRSINTNMEPEHCLWAAVIKQAIKDIQERPRKKNEGRTSPTAEERIDALEFFFDPRVETLPHLCLLVGVPVLFIRKMAREEFVSYPQTRSYEQLLFSL